MSDTLVYTSEEPEIEFGLHNSRVARVGAELFGSFLLFFMLFAGTTWVALMSTYSMVAVVGLITGLAYAAVTLIFGKVSGGHFNPAVSFAAALTSQISWLDAILYIIAQIVASIGAGALVKVMLPTSSSITLKTWLAQALNGYDKLSPSYSSLSSANLTFGIATAIVIEILLTCVVIGAYFSTVDESGKHKPSHVAAVGVAYGASTMVAYYIDGGSFNPARSTGIAIVSKIFTNTSTNPLSQLWVFWICPLLGAAVVALVCIIRTSVVANQRAAAQELIAMRMEKEAAEEAEYDFDSVDGDEYDEDYDESEEPDESDESDESSDEASQDSEINADDSEKVEQAAESTTKTSVNIVFESSEEANEGNETK